DRITAAEFVTPPELAEWSLAASGAGRIGGVRLELIADAAVTHLGYCYQQVPLRVLPPFSFGPGQPSLVYLLNPTAGLMDGDAQLVRLRAGPGTRSVVTGQSATRIHPAIRGFSTQQWIIQVAKGAVLLVLPGPAIPFQGCRCFQRISIDLEEGADLVWGDLWVAGRYERGVASERFQFQAIVQETIVRRAGRLVFRDRFCWRGPWDERTAAWHFGAAPACGSLFVTGSFVDNGHAAHFATAAGDTCFRWCGESEAVVAGLVETALRAAGEKSGRTWLKQPDLAPNHWFRTNGESRGLSVSDIHEDRRRW
ncbi:MAG TPA: urease accessory protein UreD, partial [Gemmataceae bacterium]|nr:urease accessory protein UreD [Gemmataceae bacterium]